MPDQAATRIQASYRGHLVRTSPTKLGSSAGTAAIGMPEAPRPAGESPTVGGGRGSSPGGSGRGAKAPVRPPWGATPSAAAAALRRGDSPPVAKARSPTPTRMTTTASPSPVQASPQLKRTASAKAAAASAANGVASRPLMPEPEFESADVPRYLQATAAASAKTVKSPPRTPPTSVRSQNSDERFPRTLHKSYAVAHTAFNFCAARLSLRWISPVLHTPALLRRLLLLCHVNVRARLLLFCHCV